MENEFFIHVKEEDKHLVMTRPERIKGDAFSPCCMMPEDVDYEMSTGKHSEILEICGMTQEGLEYFAEKYGKTYRYLSFFKCQLIKDFSPLSSLENLEEVDIYWNIRSERFWDMSKNKSLKKISVQDAKKMTLSPKDLDTSKTLQSVFIRGSVFNKYPMESLDGFSDIPSLKHLDLRFISLSNHSVDVLKTLPNLETFNFDAGTFTTEEIARIVAQYPDLRGSSLCAYNKTDAFLNDVRICGYKKPSLDLPKDQKRLDRSISEFNALVEKYKTEL